MSKVYLCGNTLRFQCSFYNFNNQLTDPDLVKLIIYNSAYDKLYEFTLTKTSNKLSTGVFYYDWVTNIENTKRSYIYEFYGEIDGKPSLDRGDFSVTFKNSK